MMGDLCILFSFFLVSNNSFEEDEVVVTKVIRLHRLNIKNELIEVLKDSNILSCELKIKIIDVRGKVEEGSGVGVIRDAFCIFFNDFNFSNTFGREEKVPSLRHDMGKMEWQSVARILVYLLKREIGYFPLVLSPSFMISAIFGDNAINNDILIESFKNYVSLEEKDLISNGNFEDEDVIQMFSDYNCKRIPKSKQEFIDLILEVAHMELLQKPRYVSNCFSEIFRKYKLYPFDSAANLVEFYEKKKPSVRKVIKCLNAISSKKHEIQTMDFLIKYLKSMDKNTLCMFLRFVTGGDLLPPKINVEFVDQEPRMPRARTCGCLLMISSSYECVNELSKEFSHIFKSPEAFAFSFI